MVTVITILNHVTSRGISDSLTFPHLQEQHHLQCKHYPLVLNMQLKIGFCRHFKGHNFHGIFFKAYFTDLSSLHLITKALQHVPVCLLPLGAFAVYCSHYKFKALVKRRGCRQFLPIMAVHRCKKNRILCSQE